MQKETYEDFVANNHSELMQGFVMEQIDLFTIYCEDEYKNEQNH